MTNLQPAALTDFKPLVRGRLQLVCSAGFDVVEDEELRGGGRDRGDRRADRLRGRRLGSERIRAQGKFPGAGRRGDVPGLAAPGRANPPDDRGPQQRLTDDPERRGHDLQRHLRVPRAQGPGHRRRSVLRRPRAGEPGQPLATDLDRRPAARPVPFVCKAGRPGRRRDRLLEHLGAGSSSSRARPRSSGGPSRRSSPAGTSSPGRSRPASTATPRPCWPTDRRLRARSR